MFLGPVSTVSPDALARGQRALVRDSAWASVTGAFSGGVILVAFALALGATPLQIGLLAAIPSIAQTAQLPATLLIERLRRRRLIGVVMVCAARVLIFSLALLPLVTRPGAALAILIVAQALICAFNAFGACAINAWLHQLLPRRGLGRFFSRRLFWGTTLSCVVTLMASAMVEHGPFDNPTHAYALAFACSGLAGFVSAWYLAQAPEPRMTAATEHASVGRRLWAPFADPAFRPLLIFLGAWTVASNMAAPFLAVYLMKQLGYPLTTVTGLWVVSQIANAFTLYLWGRLSDRYSNKAVLAVALPGYFVCTLAWVFADSGWAPSLQLAWLVLIHIGMGIASGGIGLATGSIGLKLAPQGRGTAYLTSIGLVNAVCGGLAPIAAGALAQTFQASALSAVVRWVSSTDAREFTVVRFAHWEFLFAFSALVGLYVMHALSRIDEGDTVSEREVMQQFALEALRTVNTLSSIGGALGGLFPFDRLADRLAWWRTPAATRASPGVAADNS